MDKKYKIEFTEHNTPEEQQAKIRAFLNESKKKRTAKLFLFLYQVGPQTKQQLVVNFGKVIGEVLSAYSITNMLVSLGVYGLAGSKTAKDALSGTPNILNDAIIKQYNEFLQRLPSNMQQRFRKMIYHFVLPSPQNEKYIEWAANCVGWGIK